LTFTWGWMVCNLTEPMKERASKLPADFFGEPFRIFFPAGILLGMAGVALWPVYYGGLVSTYPATTHARLMIEGFMASFIMGFLGTAGPRITSTAAFSRGEVLVLLTLDLLAAGLHFGNAHRAGDLLFALCLAIFLLLIAGRFVRRKDSPPPHFALIALGLVNGVAGAMLTGLFEDKVYTIAYRVGAMCLEQGFVLFPILGVAPFLLPRILGKPPGDDLPESPNLPPGWLKRAAFAAGVGLIIDGTFVLQAFDVVEAAQWLRFGVVLIYLVAKMSRSGRSFLGTCLRIGIWTVPVGIAMEFMWPQYRIGALHVVFIGGFSFIVLTVALRVVFGHSGRQDLLRKRLPFFITAAVLIFLAALSRYIADAAPAARTVHLVAAAGCWLAATVIWLVRVVPKVTVAEPEE
jgi:uncharacterized protein involved in response to NO